MKTVPKSRLLLLELVADLFIFALCAANRHFTAARRHVLIIRFRPPLFSEPPL